MEHIAYLTSPSSLHKTNVVRYHSTCRDNAAINPTPIYSPWAAQGPPTNVHCQDN